MRHPAVVNELEFVELCMCVSRGYLPEREIPELFLDIIHAMLIEFGVERFDKRMRINDAIDELCRHLEKYPEKTHLQVFLRMKLERDLEL
ncbi:hypothetical protein SBP02_11910 [Pseudomonas benzenivorans]|uniref:Uncharacterized protein n=1 Tax=Pseudomonas benzenivorans TaxID=556533 RepID=A0ABZ0PRG0_9PSED|nr:hypothetical protein [Pseudomonas benzenivorans]WPC03490.1 hypothetical protein SBP02_11910 [Pseudomonas benzenivorans]